MISSVASNANGGSTSGATKAQGGEDNSPRSVEADIEGRPVHASNVQAQVKESQGVSFDPSPPIDDSSDEEDGFAPELIREVATRVDIKTHSLVHSNDDSNDDDCLPSRERCLEIINRLDVKTDRKVGSMQKGLKEGVKETVHDGEDDCFPSRERCREVIARLDAKAHSLVHSSNDGKGTRSGEGHNGVGQGLGSVLVELKALHKTVKKSKDVDAKLVFQLTSKVEKLKAVNHQLRAYVQKQKEKIRELKDKHSEEKRAWEEERRQLLQQLKEATHKKNFDGRKRAPNLSSSKVSLKGGNAR